MAGKFSLKAIHGCIKSNKSHSHLDIKTGLEVSDEMKGYHLLSKTDQNTLEKNLRRYCKMDTLAIVDIINYLATLRESKT